MARRAWLIRPLPPSPSILFNYRHYLNDLNSSRICLTNHTKPKSHHITPQVINSLGGGHTDTHAHTHMHAYRLHGQKAMLRGQAGAWLNKKGEFISLKYHETLLKYRLPSLTTVIRHGICQSRVQLTSDTSYRSNLSGHCRLVLGRM